MPSAHHDEPVWTMTVHYGEGGRKRTAVPGQMGVSREEIRNKFRRSTFNMLNNVEAAVREVKADTRRVVEAVTAEDSRNQREVHDRLLKDFCEYREVSSEMLDGLVKCDEFLTNELKTLKALPVFEFVFLQSCAHPYPHAVKRKWRNPLLGAAAPSRTRR